MRKWIPRFKLRHLLVLTALAAILVGFFTQVTSVWYDNKPGCRQLIISFDCPVSGLDSVTFSTTEPYLVRWLLIEKDRDQSPPPDGKKMFDDFKGAERSLSFRNGYVYEPVIISRYPAAVAAASEPPDSGPEPPPNPFKRVASPSVAE